jgi:phospholipid-translocating ATPase
VSLRRNLSKTVSPPLSFFAGIAILQFFPRFSTISPGLVLLPLIAVLLISAIKDGYEDIKRHQSDRAVNHSIVHVLEAPDWVNPNATGKKSKTFVRAIFRKKAKGSVEGDVEAPASGEPNSQPSLVDEEAGAKEPRWKPTIWEDLRVGDFVKLHDNEPVPADIVICATSEDENVAYVETKNLDGETNLKSRNAIPSLTHLRTAEACADANLASFTVESDSPQENMYKLNAKVQLADSSVKPSPVEIQTVLLRGTVIRHTEWVIGVVLFTGEDSKVVMNSSGAPSKRSKVEKQMNPQV